MRESIQLSIQQLPLDLLTKEFGQVACLNSNGFTGKNLLALGVRHELYVQNAGDSPFEKLEEFRAVYPDWAFGYLTYELKDSLENLRSENPDTIHWPLLHFFVPEFVLEWNRGVGVLHYHRDPNSDARFVRLKSMITSVESEDFISGSLPDFNEVVSKQEYLDKVERIKQHIQLGDVYELNYCIPFETNVSGLNTVALYGALNRLTRAPFSVIFQSKDHALISGSPERFLSRTGDVLTAQPIKGTIRRGLGSDDDLLKEQLRNDPKERAENIMITDLMRNDLSRVAAPSSVKVTELCGVYTFNTVHQMISTIEAKLDRGKSSVDALRAAFPPGSMTGAPKIRAMELAEAFEARRRGMYSGCFGYFTPDDDFDFNVIIRSFLYNRVNGNLSFHVGGAITHQSNPESEYEECMLKAEALLKATKAQDDVAAV
jgi:para-aminobenzoate synthetase component 1